MEIRMPPPKSMSLSDRLNAQQCPFQNCNKRKEDQGFFMLSQSNGVRHVDLHFCFPECAARGYNQLEEISAALGATEVSLYYLLGNGQCACEYVLPEKAFKAAA